MTDDIPETQFEAITRRRRELRASLGMSPVAPREILSNAVAAVTNQIIQSQQNPQDHPTQGLGSRLRGILPGTRPSTSEEPLLPEENSIEFWDKRLRERKKEEPVYGSHDWEDWEAENREIRNRIFRLKHPRTGLSSIEFDKPSRSSVVK